MNRNTGIDILRIVSCFMVVCIHTCLNYQYGLESLNNTLALVGQSLFRIGLPVFFMLSGYFILNSKVDFSVESLYFRIKKIITPFIFFSMVHWFIINKEMVLSFAGMIDYIYALTVRNSISMHFWFVYSLIGLYLFSQPINYLLKNISEKGAFCGLILIAFLFLYNGDLPSVSNVLPVPYIDKWTAYFIAGGLLFRIRDKISFIQAGILSIIGYISIMILSVYNSGHHYPMPYDFSISMFAACSGVVLFFSKINAAKDYFLSKLSASTYGAYLIHICVLKIISPLYFGYIHLPGVFNYFISTLTVAAIVFIISMAISFLFTPIIDVFVSMKLKKTL